MNATSYPPRFSAGSLWRAIRGPVMLITLGALMAMDQNGVAGFTKTWPALLIVFGIFKLLERQAPVEPPPGTPYISPKA